MSGNFNNKDYNEYFKALEKRITDEKSGQIKRDTGKEIGTGSPKQKSGLYKVIRLKLPVMVTSILVIAGIVFGTVRIAGSISSKGDTKPQNNVVSNQSYNKPETTKKITFDYTDDTGSIMVENDAKNIIIIDTESNNVVAHRDSKKRAYPASTTKIMTLLVAVENIKDFNDTFTMTLAITDPLFEQEASVAGFVNGEVISMTDLLYGTILPSGADASIGLAIKIAGSEKAFVKLMNAKVKELGLKNTNFTNVSGLFDKNHYSTAYDMAVILKAALENETCKEVLSKYQHTTAATPQHPEGILLSSTLFSYMYGTEPEVATILGGKTGFVNESGYCIASYGTNNTTGNEYIVVTLGNSARWPAFYGQIELYKEYVK